MYAVIHNNTNVILAPVEWNSAFIQASLKRKGIHVSAPRREPTIFPLALSDTVKVVRAKHIREEINPLTHFYKGPNWDLSDPTVAVANYDVLESPLDFVKSNYKDMVTKERYRREILGIEYDLDGIKVKISTSREDRNLFSERFLVMTPKQTINWKFAEGWLTISKEDIKGILTAMGTYIQSQFDWELSVIKQIEECSDIESITAIKILSTKDTVDRLSQRGAKSLREKALEKKRQSANVEK
jgi:uncharacterized protein YqgV (UPF0045/DUF77 family)